MSKDLLPMAVGLGVGFATLLVSFVIMAGSIWSEIHSGKIEHRGGLEIVMDYAARR